MVATKGYWRVVTVVVLSLWTLGTAHAQQAGDASAGAPDSDEYYKKVIKNYLTSNWAPLAADLKAFPRFSSKLTPEQRKDIVYIRTTAPEHRPGWWTNCKKTSNISFGAKIWNRQFTANYMPTEELGAQAPVGVRQGKLMVIVTWKPGMVDSPTKIDGWLAKRHNLTHGDLADAIVWHELGHNYISISLPLNHVIELYQNHLLLYFHVQEFYADMTALYHAGPKGRIATMLIRSASLHVNKAEEPHTRAAYGIGSLILAHVLDDPTKWPSFSFPAEIPTEDVERNTILYMYDNLSPDWTLQEDKQLRQLVKQFIMTKGDAVLRTRGEIALPNRLAFRLMTSEDRELQTKRGEWVTKALKKLIEDGKIKPAESNKKPEGERIDIPF
ncbi:MAG: hypothetical protein GXY38_05830 [Planctomycetes bacterium]|nr:hypothetical protein [Planctomycetota bacterium]